MGTKKKPPKAEPPAALDNLRVSAPVLDLGLIDDNACRCGCCHGKIKRRRGVCMGRPIPALGLLPVHVCEVCINVAVACIASAREGLI